MVAAMGSSYNGLFSEKTKARYMKLDRQLILICVQHHGAHGASYLYKSDKVETSLCGKKFKIVVDYFSIFLYSFSPDVTQYTLLNQLLKFFHEMCILGVLKTSKVYLLVEIIDPPRQVSPGIEMLS